MEQIVNHQVVSFDVFDTLLTRPFRKPTHLFQYLEEIFALPGFYMQRVQAESLARKRNADSEEITLEQIYSNLPASHMAVMDEEVKTEYNISKSRPDLLALYNYAISLGKIVIVTSDMYLSRECVESMLSKNGISNYHKLYLSSEIGLTKRSGNLFRYLLADLNVKPENVLHIGDNEKSDYSVPRVIGLDAILVRKVSEAYPKKCKYLQKSKNDTWHYSVLFGSICEAYAVSADYWYQWGYSVGGPICYSFTKWIHNIARDSPGTVLFVARDGYLLKQIYDRLCQADNSCCDSQYVYAPRSAWALTQIIKTRQISNWAADTLIDHYADYQFKKSGNLSDLNTDLLNQIEKELDDYSKYIREFQISDKVYLVDSITRPFSSQSLLEHYLEQKIEGLYWWVVYPNNKFDYQSYQKENRRRLLSWNTMEFLMSSSENTLHSICDGRPIFVESGPTELSRQEIFKSIEKGVIDYCERMINSGLVEYSPSNDLITQWFNTYITNPEVRDKEMFEQIEHSKRSSNTELKPLNPFRSKWDWIKMDLKNWIRARKQS